YPGTVWTVPLLQEQLQHETGLRPSEDTVRRALHRLDYVCKRPRYALDPDPELRGKKEAHPPADPGLAAAERCAGRGRDRPAAVPAPAGRLVAPGPARARGAQRPQRPAGGLRGHEPAHGPPAVPGAGAAAGSGLPGVPASGPFALPGLARGPAVG